MIVLERDIEKEYKTNKKIILAKSEGYMTDLLDKRSLEEQEIKSSEFWKRGDPLHRDSLVKINALSEEINIIDNDIEEIENNFNTECRIHNRPTGKTNGNHSLLMNTALYIFLLGLIMIGDQYYTARALEHRFDSQTSNLIALVIAVFLGGVCHYAGENIKRRKILPAVIFCIIALILTAGPTGLRYYDENNSESTEYIFNSSDNIGEDIYQGQEDMELASKSFLLTLAAIALALVAVSIAISHQRPDSSPSFQQNYIAKHKRIPLLESKKNEINSDIMNIANENNTKISGLMSSLLDQDSATKVHISIYEKTIGDYNILATHFNSVTDLAETMAETSIALYRSENRNKRNGIPEPALWQKEPEVNFEKKPLLSNGILELFKIKLV